jgi:hypothetical protein
MKALFVILAFAASAAVTVLAILGSAYQAGWL